MEASALQQTARLPALAGRSPLLRLQSDERLVALIRRGQHGAFEALVQRYQPRLLAFCRHMLSSQEDAEDVLQEVFAAAFNAICADARPINARPWLYRIARNRCLNHLRRASAAGQDSMDVFEGDGGITTADTVHRREEFRHIVRDVQELPETQRTALLLREIDALSYEQIAEAMDTTVPSVKSLLVRARVSLAEAAEARLLTCAEVRLELGSVAEGIAKSSAPVRRHLRTCERCRIFRGELRKTSKALASIYPLGPLVLMKKFWVAKLGLGGGAAAAAGSTGGAGAGAGAGVAGAAASAAGGITAGGAVSAGVSTLAGKAAAGMAAAVIVTAGAVEVKHAANPQPVAPTEQVAVAPVTAAPQAPPAAPAPVAKPAAAKPHPKPVVKKEPAKKPEPAPVAAAPAPPPAPPAAPPAPAQAPPAPPAEQQESSTVVLPPPAEEVVTPTTPADEPTPPGEPTQPATPPASTTPVPPPPAPPAGEPGAGTGSGEPPPAPAPPPPPGQ